MTGASPSFFRRRFSHCQEIARIAFVCSDGISAAKFGATASGE